MSLIIEISRYSLLVPVVASLVIIKKADTKWLPFMFFLYTGMIVELISSYQTKQGISNATVSNIYALAEILLIIWLFYNWSLIKSKHFAIYLGVVFMVAFIAESFLIQKPHTFNLYFNILSSMSIVIMSILNMNKIILSENNTLVKNPAFLTCVVFIIYFTYLALVEIFYIYGLSENAAFSDKMYSILTIINLFTNLTYAMVFLWIPRKRYSLL